jgi:hypothetical protein
MCTFARYALLYVRKSLEFFWRLQPLQTSCVTARLYYILTTKARMQCLGCLCAQLSLLPSGAEYTTARGSAKAFDHNQVIHEVWTLVFKQRIHLWVERVPSKYNISDSPSRSEYLIMDDIHAQWRRPVLDSLHILPH